MRLIRRGLLLAKAHASGYPLQGRLTYQGLQISVEQRAGSTRSGTDERGVPWRTTMAYPYGYLRGTEGADGDHLDCYVGPVPDATHAYVVDQVNPLTGAFDEQKVMLGFADRDAARAAYLAHYDTPAFLGGITALPMGAFKTYVLKRENWQRRLTHERVHDTSEEQLLGHLAQHYDLSTDPANTSRGVYVGLNLPADQTAGVAVPGGLPASTLHVTVAYLGTLDALLADDAASLDAVASALHDLAATLPPMAAILHDPDTFPSEGQVPQILHVTASHLLPLHRAVLRVCALSGTPASTRHPFTPHLTVAYAEPDAPHPHAGRPAVAVTFRTLDLQLGPNRVSFPLTGSRMAKAQQAPAADPTGAARALLAQLSGDLIHTHRAERRIKAGVAQLAHGHTQAAHTLGAPIRDLRDSALADAYLEHREDANTAHRLHDAL